MAIETRIDGHQLKRMLLFGAQNLDKHKARVDNLNVFPVPDGDTGTNMSMTMNSAAKFIHQIPESDITVTNVIEQLSHGALMGARGNSGVILSQILGGLAKAFKGHEEIKTQHFIQGFTLGVESAYQAVNKPMEGTILTVIREAADEIGQYDPNGTIEACLTHYLEAGYQSLARTPEILPVLKQANVVDAGGQGFLIIVEGFLMALKDEDLTFPVAAEAVSEQTDHFNHFFINHDDIHYQYCTELLLKTSQGEDAQAQNIEIKNYLDEIGDSILVVGTDAITKIHVHTNTPGDVLSYCQQFGEIDDIKINNMKSQNMELTNQEAIIEKETAVIAVSPGHGFNDIFTSLGVDYIISGGQTMNPSTEDFLRAIDDIHAQKIIILPNNKNIILTAEQAAKLVDGIEVRVIPTKTLPQGVTAMMNFFADQPLDDITKKMTQTTGQVISGEITTAVRDTTIDGQYIIKGQYLGIVDGAIKVFGDQQENVFLDMLMAMKIDEHDLCTIYYGNDLDEEYVAVFLTMAEERHPEVDFEVYAGGQNIYSLIVSVE